MFFHDLLPSQHQANTWTNANSELGPKKQICRIILIKKKRYEKKLSSVCIKAAILFRPHYVKMFLSKKKLFDLCMWSRRYHYKGNIIHSKHMYLPVADAYNQDMW